MQFLSSGIVVTKYLCLALFALMMLVFAAYAVRFGIRGLGHDLSNETYIFTPGGPFINFAIFSHMMFGGAAMALAPLQLFQSLRMRYPRMHRITGRIIAVVAIVVALGGLAYIGIRGTIAGPLMDVGFALYGGLMLVAAVQTVRHARAGDFESHMHWALRLFVLIMGSLIFRLHYALWYALTDGLGSNEQLTGPFDQVQYFAFYLPYLFALELWFRRRST